MKSTVTMTSRGVVTLPAKLRDALGLKADDVLIAEATPEGILLRPAVTLPMRRTSAPSPRWANTASARATSAPRS